MLETSVSYLCTFISDALTYLKLPQEGVERKDLSLSLKESTNQGIYIYKGEGKGNLRSLQLIQLKFRDFTS